jgi:Condensation domain
VAPALEIEDVGGLGEAEAVAGAEARLPFDLAAGPVVRVRLLRVGPEDHVVVFTVHHIVADGWSLGVLLGEMGVLYEAFSQGRDSPLPELGIHYGDFAVWQRDRLAGDGLATEAGYWRQQLADLAVLELPTDRPRPPIQGFAGARVAVRVDPGVTDALVALSRTEGATLFMAVLAALAVVLGRYAGQDDIAIGAPVAGRVRPETEELVGLFVNTLVLRVDLAGNPTFRQLLARTRDMALDAYAHQDIPFERLVDTLHTTRDPSRNPLYQVLLAFQDAPRHIHIPGLDIIELPIDPGTSHVDLGLLLGEDPDGVGGELVYNPDLFDPDTARQLVDDLTGLLASVATHPDRPIRRHRLRSVADD